MLPSQLKPVMAPNGKTNYFCSPGCKVAFDKVPEKYIGSHTDRESSQRHHRHVPNGSLMIFQQIAAIFSYIETFAL
jgi:hypothetical protein